MNAKRSFAIAAILATFVIGPATAQTPLERGRYLVESIVACGNCHTPQGPNGPLPGKAFAGGTRFEEPPFTAFGSNITPDPETGIGRWTDAQVKLAIREGRRPDGTLIGPPMPIELYRGIADSDLDAMVAYLRTVPAVKNVVPKSQYRMTLPPSWGPPVGEVKAPPATDRIAYGAYLAGPLGHCVECHTPMARDGRVLFDTHSGAGGRPFTGPWGVSVSKNITSDRERGLGAWTDAQIERAIRQGIGRDGQKLFPPMAYGHYRAISADDMSALIAWLRTLPPRVAP